jgi:hypothetical protein
LKTTIVSVYAPTSAPELFKEADSFYEILSAIVSDVPHGHMLVVLGDFNATLQPGNGVLHVSPQKTNVNAGRLTHLMNEHDLSAINTLFTKSLHCLISFVGPQGHHACLDYIHCRKKWRSS